MAAITLVGTAVTGVLLLVLVVALARGIEWRSNEIFAPAEGSSALRALAGSPVVWVLAFLGLAFGTTVLGIAAVGGLGLALPGGGVTLAIVPFALLFVAFLVAGSYSAVRGRDVSPAGATLVAALVLAGLLLVAIAGRLAMGP